MKKKRKIWIKKNVFLLTVTNFNILFVQLTNPQNSEHSVSLLNKININAE